MYANGCYWVASGWVDQSISLVRGKNMGLILPGIRVLVRKDDGRWRDCYQGIQRYGGRVSLQIKGR